MRGVLGAGAAAILLLLSAGPAGAAGDVYPAGGGTFSGGPQGWQVTGASCNLAVLCAAAGGYDGVDAGTDGSPPGSIAAKTTIGLNLLTLFKATVTLQSPDFEVTGEGAGTLHLDRQFAPGALLDLAPQATYDVALLDRTAGTRSEVSSETLYGASAFVGKDHAVTVRAGHVYAIAIAVETSSTVAGTGLLGGTTSLRFDNVALTVWTAPGGGVAPDAVGGKGKDGGAGREDKAVAGHGARASGGGGRSRLSDAGLLSLLQSSSDGAAVLKGKRLVVKRTCPAQVARSCRFSIQGLLGKRKPATTRRSIKVAKGRTKAVVLKVKPTAAPELVQRRKLLFKQTLAAGGAKATVHKRLKLVRR